MTPSASATAGSVQPKRRDNAARFFDIMLLLLGVLLGSPRNLAKPKGRRQYATPRHSGLQRCHAAAPLSMRTEFCPNDPLWFASLGAGQRDCSERPLGGHVRQPSHRVLAPGLERR